MSDRHPKFLLGDILESAQRIIAYTNDFSFQDFVEDNKTIDAVVRNLEIIGEAANRLPDEIKETNSHIDWFKIRGLRNRIVHNYFGIDYKIIWDIKENYLNELTVQITQILNNY